MADEKKITQKEMFAHIMDVCADHPEIVEFCESRLAILNKPRKTKANTESIAFAESVLEALKTKAEPVTNKDMATEFEVSSQKMSAALRRLVKEGAAVRHEGKGSKVPTTFEAIKPTE